MTTNDAPTQHGSSPKPARTYTRWAIPAVALLAGVGYFVVGLVGGDVPFAVFGLVLMVGVGVAFMIGSRHSETLAGLRDRRDERINQLDASASLFAGMVVLLVVIVMFMVEIAQGKDGSPYSQLGAVGGLSYVVAMLFLRLRR